MTVRLRFRFRQTGASCAAGTLRRRAARAGRA
jgi:hypothetical protein